MKALRFAHLAHLPIPIVLVACAALAGCGGGGGGSTASTATEVHPGAGRTATSASKGAKAGGESNGLGAGRLQSEPGPPASAFHPKPHHDSGGGAAQFVVKGADNSVQESGSEASEAELRKAAAALHDFLDARAERNWAAACTYLGKLAKQSLAQLTATSKRLRGKGCAATLAALSGKVPTQTLREAAQANVGALRMKGDGAFAIYHAAHGVVAAISMTKEGGTWKVSSLNGVPLS